VYLYQGWKASSIEDAQEFIENYSFSEPVCDGNWKQLAIRLRDTDTLIGDCGFKVFDDQQAEIGYSIAPDTQGQGYGTETVSGLLAYLFRDQDMHRIIATTDPDNTSSIRILEKLGFRREGHFKESILIRGEWKGDLLFALLKHEWEERTQSED
jgi:RimJ/RimL family protein N-acetyltransferase